MEYIAILIAFILGAYVRQPFALRKKVITKPVQSKPAAISEVERLKAESLAKQFENMMNYSGKEQDDE